MSRGRPLRHRLRTVDVDAAIERGITVVNVPDYCVDEVVENVLASTLAWHLCLRFDDRQRFAMGDLDRPLAVPIRPVHDLTDGLCAFGDIARGVAEQWWAIGRDVLAYGPYVSDDDFAAHDIEQVSHETVLGNTDVLSIHTPLTDETRRLIDADVFGQMQSNAILINTTQGAVDTGDLLAALEDDHIARACLDVLAGDEIERTAIEHRPDVLCTPHIAYRTEQAVLSFARALQHRLN